MTFRNSQYKCMLYVLEVSIISLRKMLLLTITIWRQVKITTKSFTIIYYKSFIYKSFAVIERVTEFILKLKLL